ncbi:hypothetical protein HPB50_026780 [Hyalomma asiaticum]|uniref:Uncharacterized protein n=1 Tax=Hyalomma asiaticum TaxID=266040 RepID=A0ACB7STR3_HYAAI|nr:hypothetical protein HPB50_026780 [Hyalomma asiaticum]
MLPAVVALGAYQINHVWDVTLNSGEATKRLTALKELLVKGRRCLVIDPQEQQVRIRLHWLLHGVADEDVRTALAAFGKVTERAVSASLSTPQRARGVACDASYVGGAECGARDTMGVSVSGGSSAAIKRHLEVPAILGDKKGTSNVEGPPDKAPAGRRTCLRPGPEGSTERTVVEKSLMG